MAETKKETLVLEREYVVPLRMAFRIVPRYMKAKKAMTALKQFVAKHMKSTDIKIGRSANLEVWSQGIRNPPSRITIACRKYDSGTVRVEIKGVQFEDLDKKAVEAEKAKASKSVKADAPIAEVKDAEIVAESESDAKKTEKKTNSSSQSSQEKVAKKSATETTGYAKVAKKPSAEKSA